MTRSKQTCPFKKHTNITDRQQCICLFSKIAKSAIPLHSNICIRLVAVLFCLDLEEAAAGAITVELESKEITDFNEYMFSLRPEHNVRNPWFLDYWLALTSK